MSKTPYVDFDYITDMVVDMAISENIANTEELLTVRNVITHLDFDVDISKPDKVVYSTKRDDRGRKVILLYQFSYLPMDANPNTSQNIRRPFALKVTKNNNLVYSIQSVKEMNQSFQPYIKINNGSHVEIEFEGYDGTAQIFLFGLVAEPLGTNMNG
jgi:hypothetical protein